MNEFRFLDLIFHQFWITLIVLWMNEWWKKLTFCKILPLRFSCPRQTRNHSIYYMKMKPKKSLVLQKTRRKRVTKATLRPRVINVFKKFCYFWACQNVFALLLLLLSISREVEDEKYSTMFVYIPKRFVIIISWLNTFQNVLALL